ncbi:hypothetical protein HYALB_00014063 [Hymenoscyphus albidus]|uniref:Uncharacterized protein n=1 Tax=Hymenoscyphus albidus TaxID=595503 RepID=A0A9N9Q1E9_9HELO|nr:hypothetical protein HYALB_00014063 [Hymenoscyphus albidus]
MSNRYNMDFSTFYMDICQLLNIEPNFTLKCIGTTSKNTTCPNQISEINLVGGHTALHALKRIESIDQLWNLLQFISGRLLCFHHRDQQDILQEQWWLTLLALSSSRNLWAEFQVPGAFPEEDQNILASILELSRLEVDTFFQWRDEQAKLAEAKRAQAIQAKRAAKLLAREEAANKRDYEMARLLCGIGRSADYLYDRIEIRCDKAERRKLRSTRAHW